MSDRSSPRPRLSLLVNSFNYGAFVGRAVDSALAQAGPAAEVIVVDDGSTDCSRSVLGAYRDRVRVIEQENAGQAAAINAGVRASRGEILCFLDADDWWAPGKAAAVAAAFDADPGAVLVYHRLQPVRSDGRPAFGPIPRSLVSGDIAPRLARAGGWWPFPMTSAVALRRSAWKEMGEIPPAFRISADAWLVGVAPFLGRVRALPEALGSYRIHANQWYRARDDAAMLARRAAHWRATVEATNAWLAARGRPERLSLADHHPHRAAAARLAGAGRARAGVARAQGPRLRRRARPRGAPARAGPHPARDGRRGGAVVRPLLLVSELEDYTIAFANGVAQHLPVTLGVPRRQYARLASCFDPGVDLRLIDWPRHRSAANLGFLARLTALIRRERPGLVHLLSNTTLWLNLAAPLWRPIPLVTTVHDVEVHPGDAETGRLPVWSKDLIVRQSGHVVVHGAGLKRRAEARYGKRPERVHVLSHPAITRYDALARRLGLARREPAGRFTVLLFGRLYAYKGLATLVRAEAALGSRVPGLRVVIAGRGDDPHALRAEMGDPARYEVVHRFVEDEEVARLFTEADVVVLPYTEASQSGVLNIAAAFGKPVLVTDVGELRATVEPAGLGLVVPPNDPGALACAIARLAGDADLRARLGARARAWAEGPNSPAAVGAAAAALYRDIGEARR